jgi:hypothetical protein
MTSDPAESRNLYLDKPAIVAELKELLARYQREGRSRA